MSNFLQGRDPGDEIDVGKRAKALAAEMAEYAYSCTKERRLTYLKKVSTSMRPTGTHVDHFKHALYNRILDEYSDLTNPNTSPVFDAEHATVLAYLYAFEAVLKEEIT